MTLLRYIELVTDQRENYPKYPKEHYFNPLPAFLNTAAYYLQQLKSSPSFKYVATIERQSTLYSDVEDLIYYEFIDYTFGVNKTLDNWRYLYIPVSFRDEIVEGALTFKEKYLPYIYRYEVKTASVEKIYPDTPYVHHVILNPTAQTAASTARPNVYDFESPKQHQRHPFGEHFLYTGNHFLASNSGKMIYEYVDYQQIHDFIEVIYQSLIPPTNHRFQSNLLQEFAIDGIHYNREDLFRKDYMPSVYEWQGSLPDLRATGQYTNANFSSKKRWYEYVEFQNEFPIYTILLPHPPTNRPITFVDVGLGKQMGIKLPTQFNTQTIKRKQTSSNNKIVIAP